MRLPYAILPNTAFARTNPHEGTIAISLSVDQSRLSRKADAGSKAWLLAQALSGGDTRTGRERTSPRRKEGHAKEEPGSRANHGWSKNLEFENMDGDGLPEDRFHLKLPKGQPFSQSSLPLRAS